MYCRSNIKSGKRHASRPFKANNFKRFLVFDILLSSRQEKHFYFFNKFQPCRQKSSKMLNVFAQTRRQVLRALLQTGYRYRLGTK